MTTWLPSDCAEGRSARAGAVDKRG